MSEQLQEEGGGEKGDAFSQGLVGKSKAGACLSTQGLELAGQGDPGGEPAPDLGVEQPFIPRVLCHLAVLKAHPEFEGDVQLTILGEGQALLSAARPAAGKKPAGEEADPVLMGFLGFLERQMAAHPEDIVAADEAQLKRIARLVKDAKVTIE